MCSRLFLPLYEPMRALTWKQPFAGLMLHGKIETRTWNTNYRGWVLICAGKKSYGSRELLEISGEYQMSRMKPLEPFVMDEGVAIAVARLVDCRKMTVEDEDKCFVKYRPDLFCHIYEDVWPINPMPWKGSQGWREIPFEVKFQVISKIKTNMSTKKKAYIAGKITGLNLIEAGQKFGRKQKELHEQGYETVVPLDLVPNRCSWEDAMKLCIPAMIQCDELHLLPCWQDSPGAKLERDIALRLNIPIVHH